MKFDFRFGLNFSWAILFFAGSLCALRTAPFAQAQSIFIDRNFHVRIAVKHEISNLALQGSGPYQVLSSARTALCNLTPGQACFVQITRGRPGDKTYRLVLRELNIHQVKSAIALAKSVKNTYQMPVKVLSIPAREAEETRILVVLGEFPSLESARRAISRVKGETIRFIYEDRAQAKEGQVRLLNREGETLAQDSRYLRLVPLNDEADLTLHEMKLSDAANGEPLEGRSYRGEMELTINEEGSLTAVNDLWIEYYLYSVVGAEIGSDAPDEALKAQAVAARSEAVAKIQRGIVSSSLFDFYDTPICQAYPGKGKETERVRQAVDATRGEILIWHGEPVDAVYSHCCGGVIASSNDIWDGEFEGFSVRQFDALPKQTPPDLTNWSEAYKLTAQSMEALCNPNQAGYPKYGRKYYRWDKSFTGEEFSALADRMYGTGRVRDVVVDRRTPSGRVRQLRIIGTDKTVRVHRELELREALGDIYSNFFTFEKTQDARGNLASLLIHGAGFGHGVGMCQMGAFMMGLHSYNYRQILAQYFEDVRIRRMYR